MRIGLGNTCAAICLAVFLALGSLAAGPQAWAAGAPMSDEDVFMRLPLVRLVWQKSTQPVVNDRPAPAEQPAPEPSSEPAPAEPVAEEPTDPEAVMGRSLVSAGQMVAAYLDHGKPYPAEVYGRFGAESIDEFCALVCEEAQAEGVRADVLYAQIMVETAWLQFGGQVSPEQCNFGGLGATNDGAAGATFEDVRTGLRAQVQHLKAYASTEDLQQECVDPRFDLVERGCAPLIDDLGGRWAVPGDTYGPSIRHVIDLAAAMPDPEASAPAE